MRNIPSYFNTELNVTADRIKEIDRQLEEKRKDIKSLDKTRDNLMGNLTESTYHWFLHYQLMVDYDDGRKGDKWCNSDEVSGSPFYMGELVETEEECRKAIDKAKEEIKGRVGEEVEIRLYVWQDIPHKGIITGFNISRIGLTKGEFKGYDKDNVLFKEIGKDLYQDRHSD